MTTQRTPLPLAAAMFALLSGGAMAQDDILNQPGIYGGMSWFNMDSQRETENDHGIMLGGELPVSKRLSATLEMYGNKSDMHYVNDRARNKYYRVGGNYHFNRIGTWQPYVALGVGNVTHNPRLRGTDGALAGDIGLGVKVPIGNGFFLRADAKSIIGDHDTQDFVAGLSFGYSFGGETSRPTTASRDTRDTTSSPSPDTQIKDDDNDGIPNTRDMCPNTPSSVEVDERGCTVMETVEVTERLEVYFDTDRAVVDAEYHDNIAAFAAFLEEHSDSPIRFEGHTDSDGTSEYNKRLSERRAKAVMNVLVNRHDISRDRLESIGYGETRPATDGDNDTSRSKAMNRRVEAIAEGTEERPVKR